MFRVMEVRHNLLFAKVLQTRKNDEYNCEEIVEFDDINNVKTYILNSNK